MAVNSTHPEYDASLAGWLRARDVLAGEDAVKGGGEKYLARLESQTDEEYAAYLGRASYYNASARTADGYLGLVFRRPPFVKVPVDRRRSAFRINPLFCLIQGFNQLPVAAVANILRRTATVPVFNVTNTQPTVHWVAPGYYGSAATTIASAEVASVRELASQAHHG